MKVISIHSFPQIQASVNRDQRQAPQPKPQAKEPSAFAQILNECLKK